MKVMNCEYSSHKYPRDVYLNPFIGDLALNLMHDIYKCQYFEHQPDFDLNNELNMVL